MEKTLEKKKAAIIKALKKGKMTKQNIDNADYRITQNANLFVFIKGGFMMHRLCIAIGCLCLLLLTTGCGGRKQKKPDSPETKLDKVDKVKTRVKIEYC